MSASMMHRDGASARVHARIAGVFYLLNTLTIVAAIFLIRGIAVSGSPAATAANLLAQPWRFQLGIAVEVVSTACSVVVAAFFVELFNPVSRSLSLLAAFFRLTACAIAIVGYLFQLAPLRILERAPAFSALSSEQLQALAYAPFVLSSQASNLVIVLFGFHFVVLGYLILRSTFLPRALGVLVAVAGMSGLILLVPSLGTQLFKYFVGIGLIGELSLTAWLLAMGVNVHRWNAQISLGE